MALPPGPRSMLVSTLSYLRDPYGSALRTQARYGDTYTLPTAFGKGGAAWHASATR